MNLHFIFCLFIYFGAGDGTQGFVHATHELYASSSLGSLLSVV